MAVRPDESCCEEAREIVMAVPVRKRVTGRCDDDPREDV